MERASEHTCVYYARLVGIVKGEQNLLEELLHDRGRHALRLLEATQCIAITPKIRHTVVPILVCTVKEYTNSEKRVPGIIRFVFLKLLE